MHPNVLLNVLESYFKKTPLPTQQIGKIIDSLDSLSKNLAMAKAIEIKQNVAN